MRTIRFQLKESPVMSLKGIGIKMNSEMTIVVEVFGNYEYNLLRKTTGNPIS
jgi:hypothetical protein